MFSKANDKALFLHTLQKIQSDMITPGFWSTQGLSRQTLPKSGQQVHLLMQHGQHEGLMPFRMDVKDIVVLAPGDLP
jgi:hypothetical protein